jgi:hypothetical protein
MPKNPPSPCSGESSGTTAHENSDTLPLYDRCGTFLKYVQLPVLAFSCKVSKKIFCFSEVKKAHQQNDYR